MVRRAPPEASVLETMVKSFSGPGSGFMYAITAVLAFALAVSLERLYYLFIKWRVDGLGLLRRLEQGDLEGALKDAGDTPPGEVLRAGAGARTVDAAWEAMTASAALVETTVRQRLSYLATAGSVATMLGLLGTVYGLILAFAALGDASASARAVRLSDGIAAAMATTAWGLMVAIPALSVHAFLDARANRLLAVCEAVAARLALLKRG